MYSGCTLYELYKFRIESVKLFLGLPFFQSQQKVHSRKLAIVFFFLGFFYIGITELKEVCSPRILD